MKKKKKSIALLILTIFLLIPVSITITDKILYECGLRAIFVFKMRGGDVIEYHGICYSINYYYPETSKEDYHGPSSDWMWFWER